MASLSGEESINDSAGRYRDESISKIVYRGNTRTSDSTMEKITGLRPGVLVSTIDFENVKQQMLQTNLFAGISFDLDGMHGSVTLTITVEEKISLIPLPFASFSGGKWNAGGYVIDTNFLGARKNLSLGGSFANNGWSSFVFYSDPYFMNTNLCTSVYISAKDTEREMTNLDGDNFADFSFASLSGGVSVGVPVVKNLYSVFSASASYSEIDAADSNIYQLERKPVYAIFGLGVNYDTQQTDGHFLHGSFISAAYQYGLSLTNAGNYESTKLSGLHSFTAHSIVHSEIGFSCEYGTQPLFAMNALAGNGYRTLPQQTSFSSKSATAYTESSVPFYKTKFGIVTGNIFYEIGTYQTGPDGAASYELFTGPGIGIRMYLDKVAIPAIGVNIAYNIIATTYVFSATVGFSLN